MNHRVELDALRVDVVRGTPKIRRADIAERVLGNEMDFNF